MFIIVAEVLLDVKHVFQVNAGHKPCANSGRFLSVLRYAYTLLRLFPLRPRIERETLLIWYLLVGRKIIFRNFFVGKIYYSGTVGDYWDGPVNTVLLDFLPVRVLQLLIEYQNHQM